MKRDYQASPRLMRKLEVEDFVQGVPKNPHQVDGYVYGHHGAYDEEWVALKVPYKWDYFNILTKPLPEWVGQGNPYFDYVGQLPSVKNVTGEPAIYPWFWGPEIIAWHEMTEDQVRGFADQVKGLLRGGSVPFLDLWFRELKNWMIDPTRGPRYAEVAGDLTKWQPNMELLLRLLTPPALEAGGIQYPMTNGDRVSTTPQYLERSGATWEVDLELWRQMEGHVLELRTDWPEQYANQAFQIWGRLGGWLAIDGDKAEEMYEKAHKIRSARMVLE